MATMDPGQRGFGQQRQFNIPGLPFDIGADPLSQMRPRPQGGMRPQGQIPPELLEMLMAQFFGGQGGGAPQRPPMGGGRPPVIKIEDLVRALSGGGGQRQAPQANMPVPQARR